MELKDEVQYALDESRTLILGIQILLGFDLEVFLHKSFDALPAEARALKLLGLLLLGIATLLLLAPVTRHQVVDRGSDSPGLLRFARRTAAMALAPFGLALAIDAFVVTCRIVGAGAAAAGACATALLVLGAWFGVPLCRRRSRTEGPTMSETTLNDKVRLLMTETRVVLPGTQALMGFQLIAVFQDGFDGLPSSSKGIHLVGLVALAASVTMLMLPAAFHRIAEEGSVTARLHRLSAICIIGALATLSIGLGCAAFVVIRRATGSFDGAVAASLGWAAVSFGLWFGWPAVARSALSRTARKDRAASY